MEDSVYRTSDPLLIWYTIRMAKKTSFLDVVKYVYVYFFAAVGTIMILVGVYQFSSYIFNSYVSDEYRLQSYREERCDYLSPRTAPVAENLEELTEEEQKTQKQECLKSLESERAYQQKRDLFDSVMLTGLGIVVFAIHFGWMRNRFL